MRSRANLLVLQARQLECRKKNVEKATLYLKHKREKNKELFDERHQTNSSFNADNLILLHDIKLNNCYNRKLVSQ